MILAEQMQQSVHHEVLEMVLGLDILGLGFSYHSFAGENDIADIAFRRPMAGGKRQDVRRLRLATVLAVQVGDFRVG